MGTWKDMNTSNDSDDISEVTLDEAAKISARLGVPTIHPVTIRTREDLLAFHGKDTISTYPYEENEWVFIKNLNVHVISDAGFDREWCGCKVLDVTWMSKIGIDLDTIQ